MNYPEFVCFYILILTYILVNICPKLSYSESFIYPFDSTNAYVDFWVLEEYYDGHQGVDFACNEGTPVYASLSGTVIESYDEEVIKSCNRSIPAAFGNSIVIKSGVYTIRYAHLLAHSIPFEVGEDVRAGQLVGRTSNTGYTTNSLLECLDNVGYHLHYEVRRDGFNNGLDPFDSLFIIDSDGSFRFPSEMNYGEYISKSNLITFYYNN